MGPLFSGMNQPSIKNANLSNSKTGRAAINNINANTLSNMVFRKRGFKGVVIKKHAHIAF
jgi:hypothetical protein